MATITGTIYNDIITPNAPDPALRTTGGDDIVDASGGDDTVNGGGGNDVLDGGYDDDTVNGAGGNDVLDGSDGNDRLTGGAGIDTASYASARAVVTVNLGLTTAQNTGGSDTDTLSGIENLTGSRFDDVLTGNDLNNTLDGGDGDDRLTGGSGLDTASYAFLARAGVTVNLGLTGAQNTGDAGTDTLSGIENLTGSQFNDSLTGNNLNNVLRGSGSNDALDGRGGNDTLDGGGDGDDRLTGGSGLDTASYASVSDQHGVRVDLGLTRPQDTGRFSLAGAIGGGIDTLSGIESLTGSRFDDVLTGNDLNNTLDGGLGNDSLTGGSKGVDTASYASATAGVTVNLENTGAQNTGGAGTDTLSGFENLTGSSFNDVLMGNNYRSPPRGDGLPANVFNGGAGIDTVSYSNVYSGITNLLVSISGVTVNLENTGAQNTGGGGTDTLFSIENLIGSQFNDVLRGNGSNNVLDGGDLGADQFTGGEGADTYFGSRNITSGIREDDDFFFSDGSGGTIETIHDFQVGVDDLFIEEDSYDEVRITGDDTRTVVEFVNFNFRPEGLTETVQLIGLAPDAFRMTDINDIA